MHTKMIWKSQQWPSFNQSDPTPWEAEQEEYTFLTDQLREKSGSACRSCPLAQPGAAMELGTEFLHSGFS